MVAASPLVPTTGEGILSFMNIVIVVLVVVLLAILARRIQSRRKTRTGSPERRTTHTARDE